MAHCKISILPKFATYLNPKLKRQILFIDKMVVEKSEFYTNYFPQKKNKKTIEIS